MKKIFMLAAAAATLFAVSCNRAQGPEALVEEEDNSPVAVRFGTNLSATVTKAAVDSLTSAQDLYFYAKGWDNKNQPLDEIFIDNVKANLAADVTVHATPANTQWEKGAINVWDPAYKDEQTGDQLEVPFFYGNSQEHYRFYAYYVGDAFGDAKPELDDEAKITVPFDGTQDIMLATTDLDFDNTAELSDNVIYSAKAARNGVQPTLLFKHQLSRFVFLLQFRPVDRNAEAANMTIDEITLDSPVSEVVLDIDGEPKEGLREDKQQPLAIFGEIPEHHEDWAVFTLCDVDGEPCSGGVDTAPFKDPDSGEYKAPFGESIMVAPGASVYHMVMTFSYDYNDIPLTNLQPFEWDIDLPKYIPGAKAGYVAEAGKKYIVKVVVYGPEKADISVALAEWDEIELDEIDPDKVDPEF